MNKTVTKITDFDITWYNFGLSGVCHLNGGAGDNLEVRAPEFPTEPATIYELEWSAPSVGEQMYREILSLGEKGTRVRRRIRVVRYHQ